jgi:pseudouridine-5'-monophosphatase
VIFDLDGVLLDTEKLYTEASERVLARYGERLTPSLKRRVMGREPMIGAQLVIDELRLPMDAATFLHERDRPLAALMESAKPMPGAMELVGDLVRRGVPMAVATSSDRALYPAQDRYSRVVLSLQGGRLRGRRAAAETGARPLPCGS